MSIERLAGMVAQIRPNARGHKLYGEKLKGELIAALIESGLSARAFSDRVGVSEVNLVRWRSEGVGKCGAGDGAFKKITVEGEEAKAAPASLVLRAPGGVVIEGLSISAAKELLVALTARP